MAKGSASTGGKGSKKRGINSGRASAARRRRNEQRRGDALQRGFAQFGF